MSEFSIPRKHADEAPDYMITRMFIATMLGRFMLSILCFMASLGTANWGLEFLGMDELSYNYATFPIAMGVMLLAGLCMHYRNITDSIVMLLMAVSQSISTITYFSVDSDANTFINLFFVIGFLVAAYIYHVRGQKTKYPVIVISMTMVITSVLHMDHNILGTIGYWVAGALIFLQAAQSLYKYHRYGTVNTLLMKHWESTPEEYSHTLVGTAGVLSFSILSMVLCYYVLEGSHSAPFYVMKLILSLVVLLFAFYALDHGIFGEGFLMLGISLNITIYSVMHLMHLHGAELLSTLTSALYVPLVYRFLKDGDRLLAMTALLLFLIFFLEGLTHYAQYIEVLVLVLKVISCALAICAWVEAETGRKLLSFIHVHHHHEPDDVMEPRLFCTVNTYITIGFLQVWTGVNIVTIALGVNHHIDEAFLTIIILSLISLLFVGNMFKNNMISEGILIFVMNIYILSSAILVLMEGSVPSVGYIMFAVVAIVSLVVFCMRRNVEMAVTALALMISYLLGPFDAGSDLIPGLLYMLAGSMLVFRAMLGIIFGESGFLHLFKYDERIDRGDSHMVSLVPFSLFLVSMLCFLVTLSEVDIGFNVVGLLVSAISLFLGIICVTRGDIMFFLLVLMVTIFTITISVTHLLGGELLLTSLAPLVVLGLIIAPVYYRMGWRIMGASCMISCILMAVGAFMDTDSVMNIGFNLLGATVLLYSLNLWVSHDLGIRPLQCLTMRVRSLRAD